MTTLYERPVGKTEGSETLPYEKSKAFFKKCRLLKLHVGIGLARQASTL